MIVNLLNMFGALAAFVVNVWVAVNTDRHVRRMFQAIATLSLVYFAGYLWLLTHGEQVAEWSNVMRPFGIAAWIVAGCLEPVAITMYFRKKAHSITEETRRIIDKHGVS